MDVRIKVPTWCQKVEKVKGQIMGKLIELKLTVEQVNQILGALAARPFVEVADLISLIKTTAEAQLQETPEQPKEE